MCGYKEADTRASIVGGTKTNLTTHHDGEQIYRDLLGIRAKQ